MSSKPKTKKIKYVGEHGPVSVPQQGGPDIYFEPGKLVQVDADLADSLLEQDTFEESGS